MRDFEAGYGRWVIRYRWLIIMLTLGGIFVAASGARFLTFTNNYRVFFSGDNPQLQAFEALERQYSKNDNIIFIITPKSGDVFSKETLSMVIALTREAWQIPYTIRVDSITNFQYTYATGDQLTVHDLVQDTDKLTSDGLEKIKTIALKEPLLNGRLITDGANVTAVVATIQLPGKDEVHEVPDVVRVSRLLKENYAKQYPDIEIRLSGMVMMDNAFAEAMQGDLKTLVPLSFLVMAIVLGLLIRSFVATLATVIVILFSIVAAMGLGGYIGLPITPPSMSAPTIILTVAIANCVHILVTLLHEMRNKVDKHTAITESLRINLQPVFIASITTAVGFLSMNFSDAPPFRHLGNFVALGVLVSFILSISFLPALMSLLPLKVKYGVQRQDIAMRWMGEFVVRQRRRLVIGMGILVLVLVSFLPRNELNDVFINYFDESTEFRQNADYMVKNLTGLYIADYSLVAGEAGAISNPEFLKQVEKFAKWYRKQPETIHVTVYTDIMRRLNKNMHGDDPAYYKVPEQRNLAAQYLLLYEMSLPYGLDLNNQINIDKSATRMTAILKTLSSNEVLALESRAQVWLGKNAPAIKEASGSGPTIMFANIGKRNIKSMLLGTTVALFLISLILIIALRSVKIGLISMLPNLVPAAMAFGLWGIFVGEVGLALSVVAGMTLGIVVDDTVHFLSKYLRAKREKNFTAPDAVRYAFTNVGRALVTTSVVLTVGFLILSQSRFELNSAMGMLSAIVIVFALAADFLLLPPLLMKIEDSKNEK